MTRRLIIVGESPNPTELARLRRSEAAITHPLFGSPARVLSTCAGWTGAGDTDVVHYKELYRRARLLNLCVRGWSITEARAAGERLRREDGDGRIYVCLGRRVQSAMGWPETPFFQIVTTGWDDESGSRTMWRVAIPHPSGLNRMYNDPEVRERTGEVLRDLYATSLHAWPT